MLKVEPLYITEPDLLTNPCPKQTMYNVDCHRSMQLFEGRPSSESQAIFDTLQVKPWQTLSLSKAIQAKIYEIRLALLLKIDMRRYLWERLRIISLHRHLHGHSNLQIKTRIIVQQTQLDLGVHCQHQFSLPTSLSHLDFLIRDHRRDLWQKPLCVDTISITYPAG